jgi:hypothetical protein
VGREDAGEDVGDRAGADVPVDVRCQAAARVLIDDVEDPQRQPVLGAGRDKVIRPDRVGPVGLQVPRRPRHAANGLLAVVLLGCRNFVALKAPQALDALLVDGEALEAKQLPDPAIAPARMLRRELVHPLDQAQLKLRRLRRIALG